MKTIMLEQENENIEIVLGEQDKNQIQNDINDLINDVDLETQKQMERTANVAASLGLKYVADQYRASCSKVTGKNGLFHEIPFVELSASDMKMIHIYFPTAYTNNVHKDHSGKYINGIWCRSFKDYQFDTIPCEVITQMEKHKSKFEHFIIFTPERKKIDPYLISVVKDKYEQWRFFFVARWGKDRTLSLNDIYQKLKSRLNRALFGMGVGILGFCATLYPIICMVKTDIEHPRLFAGLIIGMVVSMGVFGIFADRFQDLRSIFKNKNYGPSEI